MSDWLSFGGGVIDTGLGLIRDHFNRKHQKEINEQNWQQEQEAATTAYERQLAIMDKYNTPMAQRAMMEQAGLNVGVMYSKGGGGMGSGGAGVAKAQGASAQAAQMQANLSIARQTAEIANINADTKEKQTQANLNAKGEEEKGTYIEKMKKEIEKMEADITLSTEQAKTEVERREGLKLDNAWKEIDIRMKQYEESVQEELTQLEIKLKNKEISHKDALIDSLKAQKEQYDALKKKYEAETRGINIENQYIAQKNEKQLELLGSQIAKNQAETAIDIYELKWREETDPIKKDQMKVQLDLAKEELEQMEFATDHQAFMYHYNNVLNGIGAACDIVNTASNLLPYKITTTTTSQGYTTGGKNGKATTTTSTSTSTSTHSKF